MATFVHRPGHPQANKRGMVDKRLLVEEECGTSAYVISDTMPETRHMANGKYYTSKTEFRRQTKASGCIEVGNETSYMMRPRKSVDLSREERRRHIKNAINFLRSQ